MENKLQESIIRTLTYFDIFDYPITLVELKKYSDIKIAVSDEELLDTLDSIYMVQESSGFYHLIGREKIVEKRLVRSELSIQKMAKARIISKILSHIPFVKLIGVSGSLSMNNSLPEDDIDLFFVTQKNTLWITRLFVSLSLLVIGQKRKRRKKMAKDKICPNMFLSEEALGFSKKRQNLYLAHEILQLKVLFDKDDIYPKLIQKNEWVEKILPNGYQEVIVKKESPSLISFLLSPFLLSIDRICYFLQKIYMAPVITIERITKNSAFFHPVDKGHIILDLYDFKSKINIERFNSNQWIRSDEARFYFDEKKMRILN